MAGEAILTRDDIVWGLDRIRKGLADLGATGTLKIIGGSAMILGGHADRASTVDVDAVVLVPREVMTAIAARIARERAWPDNWINLEAEGLNPAYAGPPLWTARPELSDASLTVETCHAGGAARHEAERFASRPGRRRHPSVDDRVRSGDDPRSG